MTSDSETGGLIDDEGNLFGLVNVVDALVVLLVLAVLVAGIGLVLGGGDSEPAPAPETGTTFVTIDLGTQPEYIVAALEEGDTYAPDTGSNLTITDIYLAPQGNQTRALVRAELEAPTDNGTLNYSNAPPRLGRDLDIRPDAYDVNGSIRDVGGGPSLNTSGTTVVVRDTVSASDADAIARGDDVVVAGRTVATVDDVAVYPTTDASRRQVLVEVNLSTYTQQGVRRFGETALRPGAQVTLPTSGYTLDGRIERVGGGLGSDSLTNRTVTLTATSVQSEVASVVQPGQTERAGGRTTAYVTDVTTTPTPIVTTTENGSVVVSDHPTLRDVRLTTELRVSETDDGVEFRGQRLQYGSTVVLDLGSVTLRTTVVGIGQ